MHAFWSGLVAGYGIAVPVGAVGAYLVTLTARTSLRVGAAAALGVATADGVFAVLAVLGGTALAGALAAVDDPLRWVAFGVLLALAVRVAVVGIREHRGGTVPTSSTAPTGRTGAGRAYLALLGTTLLNPATVVYFAALVVGGGGAVGSSAEAGALFVAGALLASASWQLLLATGGSVLGRVVTGRRGRLVMALVSAALIAGLAVSLRV